MSKFQPDSKREIPTISHITIIPPLQYITNNLKLISHSRTIFSCDPSLVHENQHLGSLKDPRGMNRSRSGHFWLEDAMLFIPNWPSWKPGLETNSGRFIVDAPNRSKLCFMSFDSYDGFPEGFTDYDRHKSSSILEN